MIVDDGSSDETESLFNDNDNENDNQSSINENVRSATTGDAFKAKRRKNDNEKKLSLTLPRREGTFFPIRYFRQENGGKHRAINRGVKEARGELFLILDSDDTLPERSLELINHYYQQIKDDASFGGVCGYMAHHDGTVIGRGNNDEVLDTNSIDAEYKYHIHGDMCEVFRTIVLRENPFPDIEGEKFVPEDLVLHRIAEKYKLRFFHKVVYYRDYIEGGLTDKIIKIRMDSPIASTICYGELCKRNIPLVYKIKAAINYYRFYFCLHSPKIVLVKISNVFYCTKLLGWLMHLHDLRVTK